MDLAVDNTKKINIFIEGKIARGDSFIGRKDLLSELMRLWNDSNGNISRSIVGLNRMGKSSLIDRFCEKVKKQDSKVICIQYTFKNDTWSQIIQFIMYKIFTEYTDQCDPYIKKICEDTLNIDLSCNKFYLNENIVDDNYKRILERMGKIGQKYLFVIDEFDAAKVCWKDKGRYFECLRDSVQKTGANFIISRRPLENIEMDSYGNSCFHNVFPEIHVCSFNKEKDMPEYYNVLENRYGIKLDEEERKDVEKYTGFCPNFLAALGGKLVSSVINDKLQLPVKEIFSDKSLKMFSNCDDISFNSSSERLDCFAITSRGLMPLFLAQL